MFITLTDSTGDKILVNSERIAYIRKDDGDCRGDLQSVVCFAEGAWISVKESVEEIQNMLHPN